MIIIFKKYVIILKKKFMINFDWFRQLCLIHCVSPLIKVYISVKTYKIYKIMGRKNKKNL